MIKLRYALSQYLIPWSQDYHRVDYNELAELLVARKQMNALTIHRTNLGINFTVFQLVRTQEVLKIK